jgi:hypothetical protein
MPWYSITNPLPDGGREPVVRVKCPDDATATDNLSARRVPRRGRLEGTHFMASLPPRHFPGGERGDAVVLV